MVFRVILGFLNPCGTLYDICLSIAIPVVIPNCTDNDYPNYYSKTSEAILEGARLLYVAMTRAKRRLIITSSKTKEVNGHAFKQYPSRFLRPIISMFN